MTTRPLPDNPYPPSAFHTAYAKCLDLEYSDSLPNPNHVPASIAARILGYLLLALREGPLTSETGHGRVAQEINGAEDDERLVALGIHFLDTFIRPFKREYIFASTEYPPRPFFDNMDPNEPIPDYCVARELALERDNYQCLLTGAWDLETFTPNGCFSPDALAILKGNPEAKFTLTRAAHIVPESIAARLSDPGYQDKTAVTGGVWDVLASFSYDQTPIPLDVNRLENLLTLNYDTHGDFNELLIWLKPTDTKNTYAVCSREPFLVKQCPPTITFTTDNPEKFPVPSCALLKLHAICCEVAWNSGAATYLRGIERMNEIQELEQKKIEWQREQDRLPTPA